MTSAVTASIRPPQENGGLCRVFQGRIAKWLQLFMVVFFLGQVVTPAPAHAINMADIVISISETMKNFVEFLVSEWRFYQEKFRNLQIIATVLEWMAKFKEMYNIMATKNDGTAAVGGAWQVLAKGDLRQVQARADAKNRAALADQQARAAGDFASTPRAMHYPGKIALIRSAAPVIYTYALNLSNDVMVGVVARGRGKTEDANGPKAVGQAARVRTGAYGSEGNTPTGNAVDGIPKAYVGKDEFMDAHMRSTAFDPRITVSEPPRIKAENEDGTEFWEFVPAKGNKDQNLFMAYQNAVYTAHGFRPSPFWGEKAMRTPAGAVFNENMKTGMARESTFTDPLAFNFAAKVRPNCTDPANAAVCLAGQDACRAAKGLGIPLTPDFKCDESLSLAQIEYLMAQACNTEEGPLALLNDKMKQTAVTKEIMICQMTANALSKMTNLRRQSVGVSMRGLAAISDTWPQR